MPWERSLLEKTQVDLSPFPAMSSTLLEINVYQLIHNEIFICKYSDKATILTSDKGLTRARTNSFVHVSAVQFFENIRDHGKGGNCS